MIDHRGIAAEPFTCSGCGLSFEAGHYYHRIGNEIYCSELDIPISLSYFRSPKEILDDILEKYE